MNIKQFFVRFVHPRCLLAMLLRSLSIFEFKIYTRHSKTILSKQKLFCERSICLVCMLYNNLFFPSMNKKCASHIFFCVYIPSLFFFSFFNSFNALLFLQCLFNKIFIYFFLSFPKTNSKLVESLLTPLFIE